MRFLINRGKRLITFFLILKQEAKAFLYAELIPDGILLTFHQQSTHNDFSNIWHKSTCVSAKNTKNYDQANSGFFQSGMVPYISDI
jgi:hypothetical protein